jgi:hypothetical protein
MTMDKNFDELHARVKARAECEHAIRIRIAESHKLTLALPRFVALAAIPLAEIGQVYPDEDPAARDV